MRALLRGPGFAEQVNLIPYNPFPGAPRDFETPSPDTINAFIAVLAKHDLKVFERRHHGRDIQVPPEPYTQSSTRSGNSSDPASPFQ